MLLKSGVPLLDQDNAGLSWVSGFKAVFLKVRSTIVLAISWNLLEMQILRLYHRPSNAE